MKLLDRILDRFQLRQKIAERIADEQEFVPANRQQRRAQMNYMKKRGAGWTRSLRKGRIKRHGS